MSDVDLSPVLPGWTRWQPLPWRITPAVLAETLDGGQAFRWQLRSDGTWLGQWSDHVVRLALDPASTVNWSSPIALAPAVATALPRYLGLDRDLAATLDALPWRGDPQLAGALAAFPGLRLLRQPFGETLLGFLCSATKQIVQIRQMMALLATRLGPALVSAPGFHRLPSWPELAAVSESALRACLLGFRARHIAGTAAFLAARPGWLGETEALPYAAAERCPYFS